MTFEELLEKVKTAKNLRRVIINSGATYIGESFASDELLFCWIFQHPAKVFEQKERGIGACVTKAGQLPRSKERGLIKALVD